MRRVFLPGAEFYFEGGTCMVANALDGVQREQSDKQQSAATASSPCLPSFMYSAAGLCGVVSGPSCQCGRGGRVHRSRALFM